MARMVMARVAQVLYIVMAHVVMALVAQVLYSYGPYSYGSSSLVTQVLYLYGPYSYGSSNSGVCACVYVCPGTYLETRLDTRP